MTAVSLVFILMLMLIFKRGGLQAFSLPQQSTSIALGFILLFAFLFGKKVKALRLPLITGFILAGLLCGPYVLSILSFPEVKSLQLLDGLALSLIALTAGGEMHWERIKGNLKTISSIVFFQTAVIVSGFAVLCILGSSLFHFFPMESLSHIFALSLLLGTLATATSPSTSIAVITETGSKGKYTDLVLYSAVTKDFFIIVLFAFSLSFSKSLLSSASQLDMGFLWHILQEIGGSILLGAVLGVAIILYLRYIKRDLVVFILGVAFLTFHISHNYAYHPLLICLLAGFLVQNFSTHGESLIQALEKVSMPVYVVFFALSGASLDLEALKQRWFVVLICVFWRGILKFLGTFLGAKLVREEPGVQKYSWAGFISQAGVAMGMAVLIAETFPEWGNEFKALVLGIIAINQIIGPVFLQKLLIKVGETGKKLAA